MSTNVTYAPAGPSGLRRFLDALRQNHAMEHATIHVISQRHPHLQLMGRTTPGGFYLYGEAPTTLVASAASEALARLQAGESSLAIHPRCGTNLAVGALVAGAATMLALGRRRRSRWEQAPDILLAITLGLFLAQPLAYSVQERVTTSADVSDVRIAGVTQEWFAGQAAHYIALERD